MQKSMQKYISNSTPEENSQTNTRRANTTPVVSQPRFVNQRLKFVTSYVCSLYGLVRFLIILSTMAGTISVAVSPKWANGRFYMPPEYFMTRDVYLIFSISGFLVALGLYIIYSTNMNNGWIFNRLPLVLIIIGFDFIFFVPMFVLGIVCAVRESSLTSPDFINVYDVNKGAFAAASFFSFLSSLLFGIDAGLHIHRSINGELQI